VKYLLVAMADMAAPVAAVVAADFAM